MGRRVGAKLHSCSVQAAILVQGGIFVEDLFALSPVLTTSFDTIRNF